MTTRPHPIDYLTSPHTLAAWQVFEVCWHLVKAGETLPERGGVPPRRIAEAFDFHENTVGERCRELTEAGVFERRLGIDPSRGHTRAVVSYLPTALAADSETAIPPNDRY